MTGTGKDPTTCRNTPEQRRKQLAYQRARGRAVTDLIKAHQAEYDHLFALRRAEVDEETEALDQAAAQKHDHGDEPARLKTGRRKQGQQAVDRIDVARCPHCVKHHDRGHTCPACGAVRPECGSEKGYQMHHYRKEVPCDPCMKGHAAAEKQRKAARDSEAEPRWVKGRNGVWRHEDGIVDDAAILRRLDGDTDVRLTKTERREVVRRARERGWSYNDITDRTGIGKPERYIRREGATA